MILMTVTLTDMATGKEIGLPVSTRLEVDGPVIRDLTAPIVEVMGGITVERRWGNHLKNLMAAAGVKAYLALRLAARNHFLSLEQVGA